MTTIDERPKVLILVNDVMFVRDKKIVKVFDKANQKLAIIPKESWRDVRNFFEDIDDD